MQVIYAKPGSEVELDSLIQETLRLTTSVKAIDLSILQLSFICCGMNYNISLYGFILQDTCSESCEKSPPSWHCMYDIHVFIYSCKHALSIRVCSYGSRMGDSVHVFHLHLTFITEFTSVHVFLEHMPVCICAVSIDCSMHVHKHVMSIPMYVFRYACQWMLAFCMVIFLQIL